MAQKQQEVNKLEKESLKENFWQDPDKAKEVLQKVIGLKKIVDFWKKLQNELQDLIDLDNMVENEELKKDIEDKFSFLEKQFEKEKIVVLLSGDYDPRNAILEIHAGTGGVDAQDFAAMLERMYLRFFEKRNWSAKILERNEGAEAGIKKVLIEIRAPYAYGYLKGESGIHRLIRLSPFNADHLRQTSFALVEVIPEIEATKEIEINPEDLRVDTYRAQGHGGQGVNTTDSAVRITHLPSKIVVTCQNERSQLQNKETALKILKSRLLEKKLQEKVILKNQLRGGKKEMTFGHQIRTYTLHPYKLVKDHRTKVEEKDVSKVLEGEIDNFIKVYLESKNKL